jgi:hypothetical protein
MELERCGLYIEKASERAIRYVLSYPMNTDGEAESEFLYVLFRRWGAMRPARDEYFSLA